MSAMDRALAPVLMGVAFSQVVSFFPSSKQAHQR